MKVEVREVEKEEYLSDMLLEAQGRGCFDLAMRLCGYFGRHMSTDAAAGFGCATRSVNGDTARDHQPDL